ncbi:MAG: hypothetical protein IJ730_04750 [Alphaproteobacteria bacterium]|nr:hypothetical protein [Alphaproteobacteria bacterium]MBR2137533.1 hypothetical protein [Alphaproteobacteria bacterium]
MNKIAMRSFITIFITLSVINLFSMEEANEQPQLMIPTTTVTTRPRAGSEAPTTSNVPVYIPQHYDVTRALHREAACCFCTARWVLQPINVVAPLISTGFIAAGEFLLEKHPNTAAVMNGIGLGFSIAQFITSVLLLKVNNKLEGIDEYIGNRQRNDENAA